MLAKAINRDILNCKSDQLVAYLDLRLIPHSTFSWLAFPDTPRTTPWSRGVVAEWVELSGAKEKARVAGRGHVSNGLDLKFFIVFVCSKFGRGNRNQMASGLAKGNRGRSPVGYVCNSGIFKSLLVCVWAVDIQPRQPVQSYCTNLRRSWYNF